MDREHADFHKVLDDLKESFNVTFVPVVIPVGASGEYKGVVNLIENKVYSFRRTGKKRSAISLPNWRIWLKKYRTELIESAAEGSDELIEKYFEAEPSNRMKFARACSSG